MRQQFNSRNNKSKILKFQKSGATASFITITSFTNALRRPSFKFFNGVETTQIASDGITYTGFTSDTAIRDIEMRFYTDTSLNFFRLENDNLYGNIDFSSLSGTSANLSLRISGNPKLTGVTNVPPKTSIFYCMNSNLTGNLIFSSTNIGDFRVSNNINLTGITHTNVTSNIGAYDVSSCNLTGNLNLTPLPNLGGFFQTSFNSNLTGITHTPSTRNFFLYSANNCNLTGNLDLTSFSGLGGQLILYSNPNLTGITHTSSSRSFSNYLVYNCNLTGNLDLTPLSGLGGTLNLDTNPNLTGVSHSVSSEIFTGYYISNCNLIGGHNLSMFSNLGGQIQMSNNINLTGVTHTASTKNIFFYNIANCNLTGTLDISMFSNFGTANSGDTISSLRLFNNPNLIDIKLPISTKYFKNNGNIESNATIQLYSCNLDYVDFKPFSGATFLSGVTIGNPRIVLRDNNMSAGDVNHILDDFKYNVTNNPTGWSNVNLNIGGSNSDPDSSSGGYDGLAAISFLTGSPYNWTITY